MLLNFYKRILWVLMLSATISCEKLDDDLDKHVNPEDKMAVRLDQVAQILSEIPLGIEHLDEVYSAVSASSENGYDEEYTMSDLFESPGRGVGARPGDTKTERSRYDNPLRDLIERHVRSTTKTKSSGGNSLDPDTFLKALTASDIQIYWPFSENWDGTSMPIITFDPEDGSEANIGYRVIVNNDGSRSLEQVVVDETMAETMPVWVVNRNSDADYTSLELLRRDDPEWGTGGGTIIVNPGTKSQGSTVKSLILRDFTMHRNYDTWFAGASEFFVKIGAVDDFTASTEAELRLFNPMVTDFMIVVKRNQAGIPQQINTMLISDWNQQMSHCAFMITEDDGGTRTEWKCTALVRIKSMSYGVELNLPFNTRDDVVWRGQLSERWLSASSGLTGSFGDLDLAFEVVEN